MTKKKYLVVLLALFFLCVIPSCSTIEVTDSAAVEEDMSLYIDLNVDIKGMKENALQGDLKTVSKLAKSSKMMAEDKKALNEVKKHMWDIDDQLTDAAEKGIYELLEFNLESAGFELTSTMNSRYILHVEFTGRHDRSEKYSDMDYSLRLEMEDTKNVSKDKLQGIVLTKYDSSIKAPESIDTLDRWLEPTWSMNGNQLAENEDELISTILEKISLQIQNNYIANL